MTRAQSEAMRRRWEDPAYRAKQARANRVNGAASHARIAELERQIAATHEALAVAEEAQTKMRLAAQDACQSVYEEWRAGAAFDNMPLAIAARIALAWREIDHGR